MPGGSSVNELIVKSEGLKAMNSVEGGARASNPQKNSYIRAKYAGIKKVRKN